MYAHYDMAIIQWLPGRGNAASQAGSQGEGIYRFKISELKIIG